MGKTTSVADLWATAEARSIAGIIADIPGLYCGPAAVGWVAAVWNRHRGRTYDFEARLGNSSLFPDGPRTFTTQPDIPWVTITKFKLNLNDLLKRETEGELRLGKSTFHKYGSIHDELKRGHPLFIRMQLNDVRDGLHYTTLYKSVKDNRRLALDKIKFYWQDNGYYGRKNGGNPGLYATAWRNVGQSMFMWGAKRVVKT